MCAFKPRYFCKINGHCKNMLDYVNFVAELEREITSAFDHRTYLCWLYWLSALIFANLQWNGEAINSNFILVILWLRNRWWNVIIDEIVAKSIISDFKQK